MSKFQKEFEIYSQSIKALKTKPTDDELLNLYGLYKQATEGNCNTSQPWVFQIKEYSKWNAWTKRKDMNNLDATKRYINVAKNLIEKYGIHESFLTSK